MEAAQARVQNAVTARSEELEKGQIRGIEAEMYRCNLKCVENQSYTVEDKDRCLERCSSRMMQIQKYVQSEMEAYQNRLQRCAMDCQDKARDKLSGSPKESEFDKIRGEMEKCMIKCADSHVDLVGPMFKRMATSIASNKYS
ncbi:protein FAM136A-like [Ylistrum balloti]|uniref:protein FAM136A-like n=1 Tax=Ylistrum balloti TaxID=509963 RepID=UPI002905AC18|nr:protein FAM136A-like [Ylistrum balloti]